jgi:hypothetical protein
MNIFYQLNLLMELTAAAGAAAATAATDSSSFMNQFFRNCFKMY